jgi:hypothetical protein
MIHEKPSVLKKSADINVKNFYICTLKATNKY